MQEREAKDDSAVEQSVWSASEPDWKMEHKSEA